MIPAGGGGRRLGEALESIFRENGGESLNRESVDSLLLSCVGVVNTLSGPAVRLYPDVQESFAKLDRDGSGKISKAEAKATFLQDMSEEEAERTWSEMDKNGDGELDLEEFEDLVKGKREWV
mmetsp:Transcript_27456/g.63825  ORF Transcript_27456/g.63825 Transcript_27456/m.63825 type:complete len:122 (+) Transcript_27456:3-368(+)